jgi:hypothetical protein
VLRCFLLNFCDAALRNQEGKQLRRQSPHPILPVIVASFNSPIALVM